MASALVYMREAVHRLGDMTNTLHDLWMEFDGIIANNAGRAVLPDDPDAGDLAQRMAFLLYNSMRFMRLINAGSEQMAALTFEHVLADEIKGQLAKDTLEQMTGIPWSVEAYGGAAILFSPEQVEVPDEIPDEWLEEGGG